MKVVIDTNIIFSVLLNSEGTIGDLIFNSQEKFEFYSCAYMRNEIRDHWEKLKKISTLSESQLQISYALVLSKLKFINEEIIPVEIWLNSEKITQKIDPDDIAFVALTKFLDASLWTGDKVLYKGLKGQDFNKLVNTTELLAMRKG
ncbi:PIN domain-containing protein [Algoriphagus chordae]|uniref:PIN domain-containing protein n=1 Tax=Algoriphagus chordae TaxID=237019 RepID=A0A2W7SA85_9BACT|nr:PIN domain-containing protein [Algoriphagus chordae]PZX47462.1 PIN domain-containing protein [Algoriphagus chordae]